MFDLAVIIGGLAALVLSVLGYGEMRRREGKRKAKDDAERADAERALDIRRSADRADERLRKYDDAGFRD
jgi:hypothetical protein